MLFSLSSLLGLLYTATAFQEAICATTPAAAPSVTVKNGTYRGINSAAYGEDWFLGMPYAQPAQRFTLARSLNTSWTGTRAATAYSPECVGYGGDDTGYQVSEDCLTLNVVRPAGLNATAKLPVAVWIHGGGLVEGGSVDRRYNLSFIVQNSIQQSTPIIGVSLNYRLSAFGFLTGSAAASAGILNNGFRDQRLALHWIQENIAAFGGDPTKVTIWGESSGAESVSAQTLAYGGRDDGLFRGVMAESGFGGILSRFTAGLNNTAGPQRVYDMLVSNTTCKGTVGAASLQCLKQLPLSALNAALNGTASSPWTPSLDGDFLQDLPGTQLMDGRFVHVPILIGANSDEGTAFGTNRGLNMSVVDTDEQFREALAFALFPAFDPTKPLAGQESQQFGGKTWGETLDEVMALYPNIQAIGIPSLAKAPVVVPGDAIAMIFGAQIRRTAAFFGDFVMHNNRRRSSLAWSKHGVPSYSYRFDVTVNGLPAIIAATHFQEVAFVFDNINGDGYMVNPFDVSTNQASYISLAKAMSSAWVNFVVSGNPNPTNATSCSSSAPVPTLGVQWPAYNIADGGGVGRNIVFDTNGSYVEYDDYRAEGIDWMIVNAKNILGS